MKAVVVCGGRNGNNQELVDRVLDYVQPTLLISGGCTGFDNRAEHWARKHGVQCVVIPACWEFYGDRAGPKRNRNMVIIGKRLCARMLVKFPGGKGTEHCARTAEAQGLEIMSVAENWMPPACEASITYSSSL